MGTSQPHRAPDELLSLRPRGARTLSVPFLSERLELSGIQVEKKASAGCNSVIKPQAADFSLSCLAKPFFSSDVSSRWVIDVGSIANSGCGATLSPGTGTCPGLPSTPAHPTHGPHLLSLAASAERLLWQGPALALGCLPVEICTPSIALGPGLCHWGSAILCLLPFSACAGTEATWLHAGQGITRREKSLCGQSEPRVRWWINVFHSSPEVATSHTNQ